MRTARKLVVKKETLSELTTADLTAVVAGTLSNVMNPCLSDLVDVCPTERCPVISQLVNPCPTHNC